MEEREIDLLEEYIANGNTEARNSAHLDELCDVIDEIRALYPPPARAELMEQTVDRIAGSLSPRQGVRRFYCRWFVNTGWASAAVAAVLLVTMGVLPHWSGDYVSTPVPRTWENASLDSQQPAVLSNRSAPFVPPAQSTVPMPPGQAMPAAVAEKASDPKAGESAVSQQKEPQTLPGSNPLPPAPATNAIRTESVKDTAKRSVRQPEVFKGLNFMVPDEKFAADEAGGAPVTKGSLNTKSALTGKPAAEQQAVPFKVLTVPDQTPVRTEISDDNPPGMTIVYNVGKTEILVRQWLRTGTEPLGPETDPERTVRLCRGDVAVEVSGDVDLTELKQFAEKLQ